MARFEFPAPGLRTPIQAPRANSIAERWVRTIRQECLEILNLIDDHSRLLLASDVLPRFKAADVLLSFQAAAEVYGLPD